MKYCSYFAIWLFLLSTISCPKPSEETNCGTGMYLEDDTCACIPNAHLIDNGETCECDSLFHWNEDFSECLLDTSSHAFMWEIYKFGSHLSYIKDIAIVNANDIWCVGYVQTDTAIYNALHWDGQEWELMLISPRGNVGPIGSVFAISETDIWFEKWNLPIHWDGERFIKFTPAESGFPSGTINRIWATSTSNIYFLGDNGRLINYNGLIFSQINCSNEVDILDVAEYGENKLWLIGYSEETNRTMISSNSNGSWQTYYDSDNINGNSFNLYGAWAQAVWSTSDYIYFPTYLSLTAYNVVTEKITYGNWSELIERDQINAIGISGNNENDIFVLSDPEGAMHFNGNSWVIQNLPTSEHWLLSIEQSQNLVIITGTTPDNSEAIVIVGSRSEI